jgi:uncharacterized protein YndB with AHSA1/START domain
MRQVLAVAVPLLFMAAFVLVASLLPWWVFGVESVLQPGSFDATPALAAWSVAAGALGALFAGRLCAAIGNSRRTVAVFALLCLLGGTGTAIAQHGKPEPGARAAGLPVADAVGRRKEPPWFTLLMPVLGAALALAGGRRAGRVADPRGEYAASVTVRATPAAVWQLLADPAGYRDWNPEILAVHGRFAPRERIRARVRLGGGAVRNVPMRVTAFEPPSRMQWTGGLPFGLFVGERTFTVQPRDGGAEFRLQLRMTGPLAPLILRTVGDRQPEIDAFATALKQRAERTG